jgi:P-type conjugative transfer protein TrbJ
MQKGGGVVMKKFKILYLILIFLIIFILPAISQMTVFDPSNFVANYGTFAKQIAALIKQLEQLNNQRIQITNQVNQIRYMKTNTDSLKHLLQLKEMMVEIEKSAKGTVGEAKNYEDLHTEYEAGYEDFTTLEPLEFTGNNFNDLRDQYYKKTLDAIGKSVASKSSLQNMKGEQKEADKLLAKSQEAEGQKQVLQATNQFLNLLGNKMDRFTTILAADSKASDAYFSQRIQEEQAPSQAFKTPAYTPGEGEELKNLGKKKRKGL